MNTACAAAFLSKIVLSAILLTTATIAATHQAVRSDHFVEHIGIVSHFNQYLGSGNAYETRYGQMIHYLRELGIRYYRQGSASGLDFAEGVADSTGMKLLLLNGYHRSPLWDTTTASKFMETLKLHKPSSILAVEGPNEYDLSNRDTWPEELQDFSRRMQLLIKADPSFSATPLVGSALAQYHPKTGNLSPYYDFGAMHWYPAGIEASHGEFNFFNWHYNNIKANTYPGKKIWLTETGYHNATATNWGVSENAAAKYLPRALMWFLYYRSVERVFIYELVDEWVNDARNDAECHWGLIRHDGTAKPVFKALKNVINLLTDKDTSFTPQELDYTIEGDTSKIMRQLFQKKSGAFYLAIWQETRSYSQASKSDTTATPRPLTLKLAQSAQRVRVFEPCDPATLSALPIARYENVNQVSISVPDHLMIIEIDINGVLPAEQIRPDLIAGNVTAMPVAPQAGDAVTFSAWVRNVGLAATGGNFAVAFSIKNASGVSTDLGAATVTSTLAVGDSVKVTSSTSWTAHAGSFTIQVTIDPANAVQELEKDNNTATLALTVAYKDYALKKPVTSGSPLAESWSTPSRAVEGNIWSAWIGLGLPDSITVDMQEDVTIHEILLGVPAEAANSRDQTITLRGSLDGQTYFTLKPSATYSFHAVNGQKVIVPIGGVKARHVRAVITANTEGDKAVLARFEVYGIGDKQDPLSIRPMSHTLNGFSSELSIAFTGNHFRRFAVPAISGTVQLQLINARGALLARTTVQSGTQDRLVWDCTGLSLPKGGMILTVSGGGQKYAIRVVNF